MLKTQAKFINKKFQKYNNKLFLIGISSNALQKSQIRMNRSKKNVYIMEEEKK